MSMTLIFVSALTAAVDPDHDHGTINESIARVVEAEPPLFKDNEDRQRTAAPVVAVAWREGSLRTKVVGDCDKKTKDGVCISGPHSFCTMQVNDSSGGSAALNEYLDLCIRTGVAMLRQSMRSCAEHPVAWYAAGPVGCSNDRAQRISRDRVALARRLRERAAASLEARL